MRYVIASKVTYNDNNELSRKRRCCFMILSEEIAIIIPFHRNIEMLMGSLATLEKTISTEVEVIIVANNQNPNEIDFNLTKRYKLYKEFKDLMWPGAINYGVSLTNRKYCIFCDPDIFYLPGWMDGILRCYQEHNDAGAIGAKLLNPLNGRILDFGMAYCTYNVSHTMKGLLPNHPIASVDRKTQSVCGAVMFTPRQLFLELGGINVTMPYIYCDNDYCLRIIQHGYNVWLASDPCVYHKGSTDKNNSKNASYSFLREDSKAAFYTQSSHLRVIDIDCWLLAFWNQYKESENLIADAYILFNFCTLLDNDIIVDTIIDKMKIEILEQHKIRIPQRDISSLPLYNFIPHDMINYHTPFLYFVDQFTSLQDNDIWFRLRNPEMDLVIDRHGNIVLFRDIIYKIV